MPERVPGLCLGRVLTPEQPAPTRNDPGELEGLPSRRGPRQWLGESRTVPSRDERHPRRHRDTRVCRASPTLSQWTSVDTRGTSVPGLPRSGWTRALGRQTASSGRWWQVPGSLGPLCEEGPCPRGQGCPERPAGSPC